ncbi:MAG: phage terminase large subunit [Candidatus Hodarchaeales archaeon]
MMKVVKRKKKSAELRELLEMKRHLIVEAKARLDARRSLLTFSKRVWPEYRISRNHEYVARVLEKALRREKGYNKIVLHEPPQHGKSLQVSILFPAYYMGHFPDDPVILTAYGDQHAIGFSKKIRNIVDSEAYDQIFPGMKLSADTRAGNRWELEGHRGGLTAAGINGAITGKGARLLLMDDPIKHRREAESPIYRENLKEAYRSTLRTRLHKDAIQILIMTRWHQDDLAGFLLKEQGFKYICLPAIAEGDDPLSRREGEPLWPERFPFEFLMETKESVGSYDWNSMYQGRPSPPEGLIFKRNYFKIVDEAPSGLNWVRFWDLATTEQNKGDYTASYRMAIDNKGNVYIADEIHAQWEWPIVRRELKRTSLREKGTLVGIESQGMQKGMVQECHADPDLVHIGIMGIPVPNSKRVRAMPVMARGEAGKLFLVRGAWNDEFIEEFLVFDVGEHDDRVDAISGGMHLLSLLNPEMHTDLQSEISGKTMQEIDEELENDGWYVEEIETDDPFTAVLMDI